MDLSVSAVAGISRATRPVSSDTQIAVLQRRLEALDKQRAQAASSSDETATYRLQALTQQMGLLQTQIAQLQQAASSAASTQEAANDASADEEEESTEASRATDTAQTTRRAQDVAEERVAASQQTRQSQEAQAADRRDAAAVAKARAEGSTVGTNVDTYA
ncbi:MAG TPA: hypothetical protein H9903_06235 [Candidatus Aquabacterium excrementipullorum]|nr:hypothetical protein [Candidatus Aquabacterium excrementipullorum]